MSTWRSVAVALLTAGTFIGIPATADAHPDSFVPCTETDLENAITAANAAGGGTLNLTPDCTYALTDTDNDANGLPKITHPIIINGNDATITRSTAAGTPSFRIFEIDPAPNGQLTLNDLTVSHGDAPQGANNRGGGIWLNGGGILTLKRVAITNNHAFQDGGGIDNDGGTVTVNASRLSQNTTTTGGGLETEGGQFTLTNSRSPATPLPGAAVAASSSAQAR